MVAGRSHRIRVDVEVITKTDTAGKITPLSIIWEDGKAYAIDRVKSCQNRASRRVEGRGMQYVVEISGTDHFLYHEDPKWFVEGIVRE